MSLVGQHTRRAVRCWRRGQTSWARSLSSRNSGRLNVRFLVSRPAYAAEVTSMRAMLHLLGCGPAGQRFIDVATLVLRVETYKREALCSVRALADNHTSNCHLTLDRGHTRGLVADNVACSRLPHHPVTLGNWLPPLTVANEVPTAPITSPKLMIVIANTALDRDVSAKPARKTCHSRSSSWNPPVGRQGVAPRHRCANESRPSSASDKDNVIG
jgi:hypothetical protein